MVRLWIRLAETPKKDTGTFDEMLVHIKEHCDSTLHQGPDWNAIHYEDLGFGSAPVEHQDRSIIFDAHLSRESTGELKQSKAGMCESVVVVAWCSDWGHAAQLVHLAIHVHEKKMKALRAHMHQMPGELFAETTSERDDPPEPKAKAKAQKKQKVKGEVLNKATRSNRRSQPNAQ